MKFPGREFGPLLAAGIMLAAVAGFAGAYQYQTASISIPAWLAAVGMGLLGAAAIGLCRPWPAGMTSRGSAVAALSFAMIAPLAAESTRLMPASHAAVALACAAAAFRMAGSWKTLVGHAICMVGACALDMTAVAMPIGAVLSGMNGWRGRTRDLALLAASVCAVFLAAAFWHTPITALRLAATADLVHQDLTLMLPVVILGLAGWAAWAGNHDSKEDADGPHWLHGWTVISMAAIALAFIGYPANIRLAVLPLWYWMAAGNDDLAQAVRKPHNAARVIGALAGPVLAVLCWAAARRWLDGLLLAIGALS